MECDTGHNSQLTRLEDEASICNSHESSSRSRPMAATNNKTQPLHSPTPHTPLPRRHEPPDGGYGWAVVCFVFFINVIDSSHFVCSGVYLPDLSDHFQRSQASMAAVLSSETLVNSLTLFFTPHLIRRVGERVTCMIGLTVSGSGVLFASVSKGYFSFILAFGVVKSIGTALTVIPANVMVQKYFSRRRALAAGLSSTGLSAGSLAFSLIHRLLISHYGWRGGLIFFSAIVFQTVLCAAMLRPLRNSSVKRSLPEKAQLVDSTAVENGILEIAENQEEIKTKVAKTSIRCLRRPSLCRKWVVVYVVGKCLSHIGVVVAFKYTVSNAIYHGIDDMWASSLPAMIGFSSAFSRLASGFLSNLRVFKSRRLAQYASGVLANGLAVIVTGFAGRSFLFHAICTLAIGICFGAHEGISYTVVTDIYGLKRLSAVMSLVDSFSGINACILLPLIGYLWDVTGNFLASFALAGGLQAIGGIVFASLLVPTRKVTSWDILTGKIEENM